VIFFFLRHLSRNNAWMAIKTKITKVSTPRYSTSSISALTAPNRYPRAHALTNPRSLPEDAVESLCLRIAQLVRTKLLMKKRASTDGEQTHSQPGSEAEQSALEGFHSDVSPFCQMGFTISISPMSLESRRPQALYWRILSILECTQSSHYIQSLTVITSPTKERSWSNLLALGIRSLNHLEGFGVHLIGHSCRLRPKELKPDKSIVPKS